MKSRMIILLVSLFCLALPCWGLQGVSLESTLLAQAAEQSQLQEVIPIIETLYASDFVVNLSAQYIGDACQNDQQVLDIYHGLSLMWSYYYVARSYYLTSSLTDVGYFAKTTPELSLTDMLGKQGASEVKGLLRTSWNVVKEEHQAYLIAVMDQLISYYDLFQKYLPEEKTAYLEIEENLGDIDWHILGFPRNENRCFSQIHPHLEASIGWMQRDTSYSILTLEHYLYTFWGRRYKEGSTETVLEVLQDGLATLKELQAQTADSQSNYEAAKDPGDPEFKPSALSQSSKPSKMPFGVVATYSTALNIRSGPGIEFPLISRAKRGELVSIRHDFGEWLYVQLEDGRVGYASSYYIKRLPPSMTDENLP